MRLLLIILLLPFVSFSQDYHFANSGNDANDGSIGSPMKTIAKANTLTGNKYFKRGDTFAGMLVVTNSGTTVTPVIIGAYGTGAKPIINSGDSCGVVLQNTQYVHVKNLSLQGSGIDTLNKQRNVDHTSLFKFATEDSAWWQNNKFGVYLLSTHTSGDRFKGNVVDSCFITGYYAGVLISNDMNRGRGGQNSWRGFDSAHIKRNEITLCSHGVLSWALTNFPMIQPSDDSLYINGYFPAFALNGRLESEVNNIHENTLIDSNYIHHIYGYNHTDYLYARAGTGIGIRHTKDFKVRHNFVTECGHAGSQVENPGQNHMRANPANMESEITTGGYWGYNESSWCRGMPNGVLDMSGADVVDGWTHNVTFERNYIHNNDGYGIGIGGFVSAGNTNSGAVIRYNLFVNNNRKNKFGDVWWNGPQTGLLFYNNVVYNSGSTNLLMGVINEIANSYFINNIFWTPFRNLHTNATNIPTFLGNVYAGGGIIKESARTLTDWRNTGQEKRYGVEYGVTINPDFNSVATPQLHPASTFTLNSFIPQGNIPNQLPLALIDSLLGSFPLIDYKLNSFDLANMKAGAIQSDITGNTTPEPPTVTGNDATNTLSASHALGNGEIVVSVNNGAYQPYTGTINVGNVERAAGYWKFKIKSASGRNESAVVNSPVFTVFNEATETEVLIYGNWKN